MQPTSCQGESGVQEGAASTAEADFDYAGAAEGVRRFTSGTGFPMLGVTESDIECP
jgi:hypothetical protein